MTDQHAGIDAVAAGAAGGEGIALPAGTEVRAGPAGDPFARALADLRLAPSDVPSSAGGVWVVLPTPWGEATGWIERDPAIR